MMRLNPLDTGLIFLFSVSLFLINITEQRMNGYSLHFKEQLARLFHA